MRKVFFLLIILIPGLIHAQGQRKSIQAVRSTEKIYIDGELKEAVWSLAPIAENFIQIATKPGMVASQPSEVKVLFDEEALYIGAKLIEISSDSILRELGKRDTEGNTDVFGVILDTYKDGINGFSFLVTAAGVQIDSRYSANGQEFSWNAVWESKVSIYSDHWIVEIKIPFSALRFSSSEEIKWRINFVRKIRRHRETSYWNKVDPSIQGFINQFGELEGLEKVDASVRLSLTPYISSYVDILSNYSSTSTNQSSANFNSGADLKYGLNESFTLDMTLVPDFGQVQSDNLVLNLSPFEVQYNEFRPFFTEGIELFNKGDLFYSRRVGGRPMNYDAIESELDSNEFIVKNPAISQLINATKISGRTNKKLGVGLFNAVVNKSYAEIQGADGKRRKLLTQPLTNYNVFVFDQGLKNNSYVSFINTNVAREGSYYDANASSLEFSLLDSANVYSLFGLGTLTAKNGKDIIDDKIGHKYEFEFSKISGNYQFGIMHGVKTDTYDPRDLGYLWNNNNIMYSIVNNYNIYEPFWKVNNFFNSVALNYSRLYNPKVFEGFIVQTESFTTFTKKFLSMGLNTEIAPIGFYDYFEPRTFGRYYYLPAFREIFYWFSTDYRKKMALDVRLSLLKYNQKDRHEIRALVSPRYRVNNRLSFILEFDKELKYSDVGFVANKSDQIVFGLRKLRTHTNLIRSTYSFNNLMSVSARIRHYWSNADYTDYYYLSEQGTLDNKLEKNAYSKNVNFNAFSIDLLYTWNFAPGSEMSVVWKNNIVTHQNELMYDYFKNVSNMLGAPQMNSLSIKILYYLDYAHVRQKVIAKPKA